MRVCATGLSLGLSLVAGAISCSPAPQSSAPTPAPASAQPAPVAPANASAGERGNPSAEAGVPRPRRARPNPLVQDSLRRAMVAEVLHSIAGRESEPAGAVFKNVKLLKSVPAAEFLRNMDENYGRGLGWTCTNCHIAGQFDSDQRKNKRIARQMQQMTDAINAEQLARMTELDADFQKVTCVTCHRGSNEPPGRMAVPQPAMTGPGAAGAPPTRARPDGGAGSTPPAGSARRR